MKSTLITKDVDFCSGQPRLDGHRLTVLDIVRSVRNLTPTEIKFNGCDYDISVDEVEAALVYCKEQQCVSDPIQVFCSGCSHHRTYECPSFEQFLSDMGFKVDSDENLIPPVGVMFVGSGDVIKDLHENWIGEDYWLIAQTIWNQLHPNTD